jgi:hypothetical protein
VNPILANLTTSYLLLGQTVAEKQAAPADPGILPSAPPSSGLPAGAVGTTITVSLLFVALVIGWWAVKYGKGRLRDVVIGSCIGVLGAGGIVGALTWTVISVGVKVVSALGGALSS